eukprot:TRINITY_DN48582_c0_g1_i1.p1 TRINITY_DN48582_c0_g1~~TRINITY_DN48582_c0_g1_i1.p1  ORF type:complete len:206 (-),score=40.50 TRINITY_DN48582_c0_g1_i1:108-725(-)
MPAEDGTSGEAPLAPGARVRLIGLQSRPDLNDTLGTVCSFVTASERWRISLDAGGDTKAFKAANLVVVEPAPAQSSAASSTSAPQKPSKPGPGVIQGSVADAAAAEEAAGRMQVQLMAAFKADQEWCERNGVSNKLLPEGCDGLARIWWHLDENVCAGNRETGQQARFAIAHMIQKPDEKDKLPLDDPRMHARVASFLKAFRDSI